MKKYLSILLLFVSCYCWGQGEYNIVIGKNAGKYLTTESYCVIVGHSEKQINARGKDMIWIVDWNEPYLVKNIDIKNILLDYYKNIIKKGKDSKDYRIGLVHNILCRNNTVIGSKSYGIFTDAVKSVSVYDMYIKLHLEGVPDYNNKYFKLLNKKNDE